MSERITVRLDDAVYDRLSDAAKARGMDVSSVVRQALMASLEGASGTAPLRCRSILRRTVWPLWSVTPHPRRSTAWRRSSRDWTRA
jgi:hypothetical protein